jgi:hypothetical protein
MYVPPELVPVNPPPEKKATMTERWNILEEIKDMRVEEPIYSTFAQGAEPDVWPKLESEASPTLALVVLFLFVVIIIGAHSALTRKIR